MLKYSRTAMVFVFSLVLFACNSKSSDVGGDRFGQEPTLSEVIQVTDVFAKATDFNGKMVRVSGTVTDVCKHKGCWMQVSDGQNVLTVRFKDEAFIIPANAIGRKVDMEGLFVMEKVSEVPNSHMACAEGGEHEGGAACESERAEKSVQKVSDIRYTMVSTGLVLS